MSRPRAFTRTSSPDTAAGAPPVSAGVDTRMASRSELADTVTASPGGAYTADARSLKTSFRLTANVSPETDTDPFPDCTTSMVSSPDASYRCSVPRFSRNRHVVNSLAPPSPRRWRSWRPSRRGSRYRVSRSMWDMLTCPRVMSTNLFNLDGRVAVVVGGTSGIGRVLALGLADAGADVVATARRAALVEEVAAAIEARGRRTSRVTTDVLDRQSLSAAADAILREL